MSNIDYRPSGWYHLSVCHNNLARYHVNIYIYTYIYIYTHNLIYSRVAHVHSNLSLQVRFESMSSWKPPANSMICTFLIAKMSSEIKHWCIEILRHQKKNSMIHWFNRLTKNQSIFQPLILTYRYFQKNRGKTPKMDGLFHGKPYEQMDDLGVKTHIFGGPPIQCRKASTFDQVDPQPNLGCDLCSRNQCIDLRWYHAGGNLVQSQSHDRPKSRNI